MSFEPVLSSPTKSTRKPRAKSPKKASTTVKKQLNFPNKFYEAPALSDNKVEVDHLKSVIASLKQKVLVTDDLQQELDQKKELLKSSEEGRQELQQRYEEMIQSNELQSKNRHEYQNQLLQRLQFLEKENQLQKSEIENLKYTLENTNHIKKNIETELANSKKHIQDLESQKIDLNEQLTVASDYLIEQDEKTHGANTTNLELVGNLKKAEVEIGTLREYIAELKRRIAVYVPIDDDLVDNKLAEYINNFPDCNQLKVMFMRESEGVYHFGTRRIYIKVEQGKIIVKVGGGFLTIDEFLDIYMPLENERMERKAQVQKDTIQKETMQKSLVNGEFGQDTPVRLPNSSSAAATPRSAKVKSKRKTKTPIAR